MGNSADNSKMGSIGRKMAALRHGPRGDFVWVAKADQTAALLSPLD